MCCYGNSMTVFALGLKQRSHEQNFDMLDIWCLTSGALIYKKAEKTED